MTQKLKTESQPLISVIMPVLNSRRKIDAALNSLIAQRSRRFEVVFSDGGSTDGTIDYAMQILSAHGIEALSIIAIGSSIYAALNHAIRLARGRWYYILGSDDCLYSAEIFDRIQPVLVSSRADVIYGDAWFETGEGFVYGGPFWPSRLAALNICHQSIFYRASRVNELALTYNEEYPLLADWDYNLKLYSCSRFQHIPLLICRFSCGGASSTRVDYKFEQERYQQIMTYFGWRSFFLFTPDWLTRCVAHRPTFINRCGLLANRLVYKLWRRLRPDDLQVNLRELAFAGSQLPCNLQQQ